MEFMGHLRLFMFIILAFSSLGLAIAFYKQKDGKIRKLLMYENISLCILFSGLFVGAILIRLKGSHGFYKGIADILLTISLVILLVFQLKLFNYIKETTILQILCDGFWAVWHKFFPEKE